MTSVLLLVFALMAPSSAHGIPHTAVATSRPIKLADKCKPPAGGGASSSCYEPSPWKPIAP